MAVDTRSRRAAVLGLVSGLALVLPLSDGTVGQPDRQHVAFSYPGILVDAPVVAATAIADVVVRCQADDYVVRCIPDDGVLNL